MPGKPGLDQRLAAFLDRQESEAQNGNTIAELRIEMEKRFGEVELGIGAVADRVARYGRRLNLIESANSADTSMFDTGQHKTVDVETALAAHELAESNKTLAEKKENELWWKRRVTIWIVGGLAYVVTTLVSIAVAVAMVKH